MLFVPLDAMAETRRWQFDAAINTPPLPNPVSLSGSFRTVGFCHRREDLSALMVPLDAIEKRASADVDAAASSATLWDDLCPLAADVPDIPPALRDRMPPGAPGFILTLPCRAASPHAVARSSAVCTLWGQFWASKFCGTFKQSFEARA